MVNSYVNNWPVYNLITTGICLYSRWSKFRIDLGTDIVDFKIQSVGWSHWVLTYSLILNITICHIFASQLCWSSFPLQG